MTTTGTIKALRDNFGFIRGSDGRIRPSQGFAGTTGKE